MKSFSKYLEEKNKGLWDNIHAKRERGEKMRKPGEKGAPTAADFKRSQKEAVEEKTLTPAEKKKREEIAKAMERENPGMDMRKKMAIATWQAKRVAEEAKQVKEGPVPGGVPDVVGYLTNTKIIKDKNGKEKRVPANEAVTVDKKNYSWGKMITVHHGSSHSFPLHPEHQEKIKNLKDGDSTTFKDETGSKVTAKREGDKVHLRTGGAGHSKTTVAHSHFTEEAEQIEEGIENMSHARLKWHMNTGVPHGRYTKNEMKKERDRRLSKVDTHAAYKAAKPSMNEEVEQIDEISKKTLGSYVKKASSDIANKAAEHDVSGATHFGPEARKYRSGLRKDIRKRETGMSKALDRLTKEEAEQIDEISKKTLGSYIKKAKDDLGNREAEVTRNRYVDPRGVTDPIKHNNALLMKRAKRRDNINKAVDKLTKESVRSADKKVEKFVKPDGKVGVRLVSVDKNVIKND